MTFLDTGIMGGAVLKSHPEHFSCVAALEESVRPFTNAHALAETFATLTGFLQGADGRCDRVDFESARLG